MSETQQFWNEIAARIANLTEQRDILLRTVVELRAQLAAVGELIDLCDDAQHGYAVPISYLRTARGEAS